ncbi:MAG: hypothetical protein RLZZ341_1395, partial [Pseudomonadota bacterium]
VYQVRHLGMGRGSADALHVMVEAKRLAFEDLAKFYADTATYNAPVAELISDDYAAKRRALIDMKRANADIPPGEIKLRQGDTTYLTTADSSGMMVSLIQSNYRGMGSGLVPDGLGFMLQDRGELFALDPAHPNVYAPAKRPFQTIIPAFVMKAGKPFMSFGVMGGDLQPQGHVQILVNMIDFGLNVQEAGDAARFRHVSSDDWTRKSSAGVGKLQLDLDCGVQPQEVGQPLGQHVLAPGDRGGQADLARQLHPQVAQALLGTGHLAQRAAGKLQVGLPGGRERDAPRAAREQRRLHRRLELRHPLAHHALADAEFAGRGTHARQLGHLHEGREHVGGDGHCFQFADNRFAVKQLP